VHVASCHADRSRQGGQEQEEGEEVTGSCVRSEVQRRVQCQQKLQEKMHQVNQGKGEKRVLERMQRGTEDVLHMQEDVFRGSEAVQEFQLR